MASIPERRELMLRALESLSAQVRDTWVYMNGYVAVPEGLPGAMSERTAIPRWGFACGGDRGACGKFYPVPGIKGRAYVLVCDDDLIYQPGYAAMMVGGVERYGRRAAVSLHGKTFNLPTTSYYGDKRKLTKYHCMAPLASDRPVMVAGTGVLAFHTDALRLAPADFPHRAPHPMVNAADLLFSDACHRRGVPLVCLAHRGGEVRHQKIDYRETIHAIYYNDCQAQTDFLNARGPLWPTYTLDEIKEAA